MSFKFRPKLWGQLQHVLCAIFQTQFLMLQGQLLALPYQGVEYRSFYFKHEPFSFMKGGTIASSFVYDVFACQTFCLRNPECLSFNFGLKPDENEHHLCIVLDVPEGYKKFKLTKSETFDFYSRYQELPHSCSHAKSLGYDESRNYQIDPDGIQGAAEPFKVYCDMRDKSGIGVTVISHNSENRTLVNGCENKGCYRHDVLYDDIVDVARQLGALTNISKVCEQYIRYECFNSVLEVSVKSPYAWLVSRDGRRLDYWGGTPRDSKTCACGLAGNCYAKNDTCNCDVNYNIWLEDSGMLNYKEDLPVTVLRFGDATLKELGYHTLGKLKCNGQA